MSLSIKTSFFKSLGWGSGVLGGAAIGTASHMLSIGIKGWGPAILLAEGIALVALPILNKVRCMRVGGTEHLVHTVNVVNPAANVHGREARASRVATILAADSLQNAPGSTSVRAVQLELATTNNV